MGSHHHMMNRVPVDKLSNFNVAEKNKVRSAFIHDTAIYAAAGHDTLQMLVVPEGGLMNDGSRNKTAEDTNLTSAGSLSQNQTMLVKSVSISFLPALSVGHSDADAAYTAATQKYGVNDLAAFYHYGLLHLSMKGIDIIKDGPLRIFPPSSRIEGSSSIANTDTDNNKMIELASCVGEPYPIEWFEWKGGDILTAKLIWPNGKVALPSGSTGRVKLRLFGDIYEAK